MSDEQKAKIGAANKAHFIADPGRTAGPRNPFYGRKHTEATRAKIPEARARQPAPVAARRTEASQ